MIDPNNVTNFNRTKDELEEYFLFTLVVAGKTAQTQTKLLDKFLNDIPYIGSPFDKLKHVINRNELLECLKKSRLGQFNRLNKAIEQSLSLDLNTCSVQDLEAIHGIGPKTARFFILHSRKDCRVAALDTHILKHLKEKGFKVPKSTPSSSKQYEYLEQEFINLADTNNMTVADYDLMIWKSYQKN